MDTFWSWVQGVGGIAGLLALALQGVGWWRHRHTPRDVDGLRRLLDIAYKHVLPIANRVKYGSPSRDIIGDEEEAMAMLEMTSYAGRLSDKTLVKALTEASVTYMHAYAVGTNLNKPPEERPAKLVKEQVELASKSLDAIKRATRRLDELERRMPPK